MRTLPASNAHEKSLIKQRNEKVAKRGPKILAATTHNKWYNNSGRQDPPVEAVRSGYVCVAKAKKLGLTGYCKKNKYPKETTQHRRPALPIKGVVVSLRNQSSRHKYAPWG